jgi:hypothetical protein
MKRLLLSSLTGLVLALALLASTGSGAQAQAASSTSWKKCGDFYLIPHDPPILFLTKGIPCIPAIEVVAHAIVEPGIVICLQEGCEAQGFKCSHPKAQGGPRVLIRCENSTGAQLAIQARSSK